MHLKSILLYGKGALLQLTPPQSRVYEFIRRQIRENGLPPTIREIGTHFDIAIGTVQDHLAILERKGYVKRSRGARHLTICVQSAAPDGRLPILGSVPAGPPAEAISNAEDFLSVDPAIAKQADYILRVRGHSMHPDIQDGDLVMVELTQRAESGEIVVASLDDGDATVKRLRRKGGEVFLEALNPAFESIHNKAFAVVGKVKSLIRPSLRK